MLNLCDRELICHQTTGFVMERYIQRRVQYFFVTRITFADNLGADQHNELALTFYKIVFVESWKSVRQPQTLHNRAVFKLFDFVDTRHARTLEIQWDAVVSNNVDR